MSDELHEYVVERDDDKGELVEDEQPKEQQEQAKQDDKGEDRRLVEEESEEDERGPQGESEEQRQARTERNRKRRKERKEFRNQRREQDRHLIQSLRTQLAEQADRLAKIEGRADNFAAAQVDARLSEFEQELTRAEGDMRKAMAAGDGDAHADAVKRMMTANTAVQTLRAYKQQNATTTRESEQPRTVTQVDPVVQRNTNRWLSDNAWFDPHSREQDSLIAKAVDQAIKDEGFDPRTQEYWDELDDRLSEVLPHRFRSRRDKGDAPPPWRQQQDRKQPRQVVGGSARDGGQGGSPTGYVISKARKDALIEAGLWDRFQSDKAYRQSMISEFKAADQQYGRA